MAKPPVSYGNAVKLTPPADAAPPEATAPAPADPPPAVGQAARRRPMESKADPTIVYLHPDGKYELKRRALARGPKVEVHDLLLEALEDRAGRHGVAAPMRVPPGSPRRSP